MIQNKEVLEQIREEAVKELNSYDCRILVCSGTGCVATGSQKIYEKFMEIAKDAPGVTIEFGPHDKDAHVGVKKTGCQGVCELGPLVRIQKGDDVIQYTKVQIEDCQEIFEKSVQGNETIERLLYQKGGKVSRGPEDIPFIAKQTRIVLKNCGKFDAESLNEYIAAAVSRLWRKQCLRWIRIWLLIRLINPVSVDVVAAASRQVRNGFR